MLAVLCALAGSLMYALASVLQQRGAQAQPLDHSLKPSLLLRLARQPVWVLGLACDGLGFVFQWVALAHGPLVIVQPLLVCGLLFALPLGAALAGRTLRTADWTGAVLVCAGLAVFLTVSNPSPGRSNAPNSAWFALLVVVLTVTGALILASRGRPLRQRAVLLSGAAGVIYGVTAALTKTSSHLLEGGVSQMASHWQPYALVLFGFGGMILGQSAFQAGTLDVSLPTMTVVDPVVSIAIGALLFHEAISSSPGAVVFETVGLVAMSIGVFMLARVETRTGVG